MKYSAAISIAIVAFLTIIIYIPKINGFSHERVKNSLSKNGAYDQIFQLVDNKLLSEAALTQDQAVNNTIHQFVTQAYIQTKTNQAIDTTSAWITGHSLTEPSVSFNDLKQAIIDGQPQGSRLTQALQDLQSAPQTITSLPQVTADPSTQALIDRFLNQPSTLASFSQGDLTVHLATPLRSLKLAYRLYTIFLFILPILLVVGLALSLLRHSTTAARLAVTGKFFLYAGIGSLILDLVAQFVIVDWGYNTLHIKLQASVPLAATLLAVIKDTLFHNSLAIAIAISLTLTGMGAILYFLSKRMTPPPLSNLPYPKPPTISSVPENSLA